MQDGGGTALWPSAERMAGDAAKKVNGDVVQTASAGRAARSRFYSVILGFSAFYLCAIGLSWLGSRWLDSRPVVTIWQHRFTLGHLHDNFLPAGVITLLVVPAVFAVELLAVGWNRSSLRSLLSGRSASGFTDLACFALWHSHALQIPKIALTFGAALVTGARLHDFLRDHAGLALSLQAFPVPLQLIGYFLILTFCDYWQHRLEHSRYFWPIHRYHHGAEEFHVLTSIRVHPANFSSVLTMTLPLALIDTPTAVVAVIGLCVSFHRFLIHSRIESDFGWVGRHLLQSPVSHRVHHRFEPAQPVANLSLFPVWDRLFGTWQEGGSQDVVIGVSAPYRQGAWILPDMWRDYLEFLARLAALLRPRKTP